MTLAKTGGGGVVPLSSQFGSVHRKTQGQPGRVGALANGSIHALCKGAALGSSQRMLCNVGPDRKSVV